MGISYLSYVFFSKKKACLVLVLLSFWFLFYCKSCNKCVETDTKNTKWNFPLSGVDFPP